MRITFLPHARDQMREYGIPEARVREALEAPDLTWQSYKNRTVAQKVFAGEKLAIKVAYNVGLEGERVVVTVMRGRPRKGGPGNGV